MFVHRWYDYLCSKSKRSEQKTPVTNKRLYKVVEYKINRQKSIAFLYINNKQGELGNKNAKFTFYMSSLQNEIVRYKSNKIYIRSIWRKLQNSKSEINGERFPVHG